MRLRLHLGVDVPQGDCGIRIRLKNVSNGELRMRSEKVYRALSHIPNRFRLCQATARATKRLHIPSTRTEDTMNSVLSEISNGKLGDVIESRAQAAPLPTVDIFAV